MKGRLRWGTGFGLWLLRSRSMPGCCFRGLRAFDAGYFLYHYWSLSETL